MGEHLKPTKILERFGLTATIIYVLALVVGIPLLAKFGYIKLDTITLNELGDFLAGAFGPLAIFWLVLGFFQQGQELRNSVATLELQAKELANSVEQQRELVNVSRKQFENDRKQSQTREKNRKKQLQPDIRIDFERGSAFYGTNEEVFYTLDISNLQNNAKRLTIKISLPWNENWSAVISYFDEGSKEKFSPCEGKKVSLINSALPFELTYYDKDEDFWEISGMLKPSNDPRGYGVFDVDIQEKLMNNISDM